MTTITTELMPANTTAPTTDPKPGTVHTEATTGKEVNSVSMFDLGPRPRRRADLDRIVVLERLRQRRKAQRHIRSVHSGLWGVRAGR